MSDKDEHNLFPILYLKKHCTKCQISIDKWEVGKFVTSEWVSLWVRALAYLDIDLLWCTLQEIKQYQPSEIIIIIIL